MNKFGGYVIGVVIAMAIAFGLSWLKGGHEQARTVGIFFLGWIAGAISMYIKPKLVYKF